MSLELKFPPHEAGLSLHHNEHKNVYMTAAAYIEEQGAHWDWVSPEQRQKAIETDSIWALQWYPNTPIAFCALAAADLDVLLTCALVEAGIDSFPQVDAGENGQ